MAADDKEKEKEEFIVLEKSLLDLIQQQQSFQTGKKYKIVVTHQPFIFSR